MVADGSSAGRRRQPAGRPRAARCVITGPRGKSLSDTAVVERPRATRTAGSGGNRLACPARGYRARVTVLVIRPEQGHDHAAVTAVHT